MKYFRGLKTAVSASVIVLVAVGATVVACGGGDSTGGTGTGTGTGTGGATSSTTGTEGTGTSSATGTGGSGTTSSSTSSGTGGGAVGGYDCAPPMGSPPALKLTEIVSGIKRPVLLKGAPGDGSQMYVVGQDGKVWIIKDGAVLPTPFLDISAEVHQPSAGDERGLLGLAFHPKYAENGRFFVYYTDKNGANSTGDQNVVEYQRSAGDPSVADPKPVQKLFTEADVESNHNGGNLEFSPKDGFLYIGMGDGGGAGDKHPTDGSPPGNGQSLSTRWGKILRLDVDSVTKPYGIPPGNMPGMGVTQEIWDYGLRNPWRFSFDACTFDLYIGDVGQDQWEEIDIEPAGQGNKNYGWRKYEGNHCYNPGNCDLMDAQFTKPVFDYQHKAVTLPENPPVSQGRCSVSGGYVYRGSAVPGLRGTYFFGDYCTNEIWTLSPGSPAISSLDAKVPSPLRVPGTNRLTSFGQDNEGEVYALTVDGHIFRIDAQ